MNLSQRAIRNLVVDFIRGVRGALPGLEDGATPEEELESLARIVTVDRRYATVDLDLVDAIRSADSNLAVPADAVFGEAKDCDDYANYLKAVLVARLRTAAALDERRQTPPAIGVVISQDHAMNLVVCRRGDDAFVGLIDTSTDDRTLIRDAAAARRALQTLPLQLIYL